MPWGEIIWTLGHFIVHSLDSDWLLAQWMGILVCVYTGLLKILQAQYCVTAHFILFYFIFLSASEWLFLFILHIRAVISTILLTWLRICWLYPRQWSKTSPTKKRGILGMTLNCICWWSSSFVDLGNAKYTFAAITPRSTLTHCGSTC